jgi:hypothetical protein
MKVTDITELVVCLDSSRGLQCVLCAEEYSAKLLSISTMVLYHLSLALSVQLSKIFLTEQF